MAWSLVHIWKLSTCSLSNTFLVRVGPGGGRIETNLPFLIYLPVTDLHIGIISIGFIDRQLDQKTKIRENHTNSKSWLFTGVSVVSYLCLVEHLLLRTPSLTPSCTYYLVGLSIKIWFNFPWRWDTLGPPEYSIPLGTVIGQVWGVGYLSRTN